MKPKHHFKLALLGIPVLLLSPSAFGQDPDEAKKPATIAETEKTAERAAEKAERVKEAAEKNEEGKPNSPGKSCAGAVFPHAVCSPSATAGAKHATPPKPPNSSAAKIAGSSCSA